VKLTLLILLFISCQFILIGQNNPCVTAPKKFVKKIIKCKLEKDPQKKISALTKILGKYPEQAEIYFEIAEFYKKAGILSLKTNSSPTEGEQTLKKAIYFYQKSIQKCRGFSYKNYFNLGDILLSMRNEKEALTCFKEVVIFEEKFPDQLSSNYEYDRIKAEKIINDLEFEQNLRNNPVPFSPSIVNQVSSDLDEYFPMLSPDNDLLFYTRKIDRTRLGDIATNVVEEFTVSSKSSNSYQFSIGDPLKNPFNDGTFHNYGSATLSVDNKEMIICACKKERVYRQSYLNCDLYSSKFKRSGKGGNDFEWSPLVNLGSNINTKDGWEAQPSLSSDGKMLFFTSIRKGSRDNDIYISLKQKDGSWGMARPFDEINTAGKDKSPFFHQDGETLYFVSSSSIERKGLGGLDIFYIRKTDSGWTEPKNIGYPINSPQDELGLFVSTSGRIAYFSSFQDGNWNIYSFELYEEARPEEVVILKGSVKNEDGSVSKGAKVQIHYDGSEELDETIEVNEDDGSYATVVKVKKAENISITVDKKGSSFAISRLKTLDIVNTLDKPTVIGELKITPIKDGEKYELEDILYETDSYDLTQESKFTLKCFKDYLMSNPNYSITIEGHTDDIGDAQDNLILSRNRAAGVKSYLIELGIDESRLSSVGLGESQPKFPNNSSLNRKNNRRTEFELRVE
jgi:outer membrane protein OmpA-like peptidoglycan-associated protein/tetratricopeptide (TPR) repeat protein